MIKYRVITTNKLFKMLNTEPRGLILTAVVDRSYFENARQWYGDRYLKPLKHRAYILVATLFILWFTFLIVKTVLLDDPVQKYPFAIYVDDQINYFPHIQRLSNSDGSVAVAVARYLLAQYVKIREGYDYNNLHTDKLTTLLRTIMSLSSQKLFRSYIDYLDPSINSTSPILRYKTNALVTVSVTSVEFPQHNHHPESAKVYYQVTEQWIGGQRKLSKWVVDTDFILSDISKVLTKEMPLKFTVTSYKPQLIEEDQIAN
ncbi:hypothetical protein EDM53_00975 [Rickettsiales endosymbiont of Peranema trichophorum]|uniref:VirB8/TrbF family protein n=1 Tax=Rickettsiales endosymbiont of Peranema trichophorum TaxID=2486577 RepID=UPI0010235D19|nr:VirB8/TrbF family protein [Rickettsiales endosymbiont of Peranema trichophorum]RZI47615.1 hypothetical protein EDM53_00975 [Rickettsiales endosymbiont of Peranema trichophorum]